MHRGLAASLVLGLIALSGCSSEQRFRTRLINKPAPSFTLPELGGGTVELAALRGKPVLLAFWAYQ